MLINIYKTQAMLAAINRMLPAHTFLRDTFVAGSVTFVTEDVLVDYRKGKRKLAPFVAPRVGGITVDRDGYRTERYTAPKIAPQRIITIDDLVMRGLGENVFSARTPDQRQGELLGRDLAELDEMITRREEWMIRELLFYGRITMKGFIDRTDANYIEQVLDYGFDNKVALTDEMWNAAGDQGSRKYDHLKAWRLDIIQKTGKAPTMCIMSEDVADLFLADADIQKRFDVRHMYFGELKPTIQNEAVTYLGRLTGLGLDLYTYNEWYLDDNGVEQPMVPPGHLLMGRPKCLEVLYGAVTQMEQGSDAFYTYEGARIPKSWAEHNNDQRMVRLSSRPVPKPEDVDDWFVAEVIGEIE